MPARSQLEFFTILVCIFGLAYFVWGRLLGNFRLGSFAWEFSSGIFRLGLFVWGPSLGNFRLGNWAPEAGGTGLLRLGEPLAGSGGTRGDQPSLQGL